MVAGDPVPAPPASPRRWWRRCRRARRCTPRAAPGRRARGGRAPRRAARGARRARPPPRGWPRRPRATRAIRSNETTIPPGTGTQPPERPVALPRAVTGTRCSVQSRSTSATCRPVSGSTTASGATGSCPSASSWPSSTPRVEPDRTRSAPTTSSSRPTTPPTAPTLDDVVTDRYEVVDTRKCTSTARRSSVGSASPARTRSRSARVSSMTWPRPARGDGPGGHRGGEVALEAAAGLRAVQVVDGAHPPVDGRARQGEDRRVGPHHQLHPERPQGRPEVALVGHREVAEHGPVAAQAAPHADRPLLAHRGLAPDHGTRVARRAARAHPPPASGAAAASPSSWWQGA